MKRTQKVCTRCGEKFLGGGNSKYCYECKDKRRNELNAKLINKRRHEKNN